VLLFGCNAADRGSCHPWTLADAVIKQFLVWFDLPVETVAPGLLLFIQLLLMSGRGGHHGSADTRDATSRARPRATGSTDAGKNAGKGH